MIFMVRVTAVEWRKITVHTNAIRTGQWDAGNQYTQEGCPGGNCLRSHGKLYISHLYYLQDAS